MATAVIGLVGGALKGLLGKGHDDDVIGEQDGEAMRNVVPPIISAVLGRTVGGDIPTVDKMTDEVAHLEERGSWPLSPSQTRDLISAGDQAQAVWCEQLKSTKWPCRAFVAGQSGAGTLFYTKWQRLRSYMVLGLAVAERQAGTAPGGFSTGTVANTSTMSNASFSSPALAASLNSSVIAQSLGLGNLSQVQLLGIAALVVVVVLVAFRGRK